MNFNEDDDEQIIKEVNRLEKEAIGKKIARLERENDALKKLKDSLERRN